MIDIDTKIEQFLDQGMTAHQVAARLKVSLEWVLSVESELLEMVTEGAYDDF